MDAPKALVLDLVEWVAQGPRPYADVLDAWRTSCPRLTVWEDAVESGLVERKVIDGLGVAVVATAAGLAYLKSDGRDGSDPARAARNLRAKDRNADQGHAKFKRTQLVRGNHQNFL